MSKFPRFKPPASANAQDLRDLKMTTVGTLCKELDACTSEAMLTGVHGGGGVEPHLVIVARGERMVNALVEAFKRVNEEMKATQPKWNLVSQGEMPSERQAGEEA